MMNNEILTTKEVAKFLKITPRSVTHLALSKKLKGTKVGRAWRFKKTDILAIFDEEETKDKNKDN